MIAVTSAGGAGTRGEGLRATIFLVWRGRPPAFWIDLAVKLSLVALLAFGAFSGLERFAGKAFGWRLGGYSIAALLLPAGQFA